MLTGDKGETALQIGRSCGLYDERFQLIKAPEVVTLGELEAIYE
jgi:magnesium-transporting ATPase (P-type)